MHPHTELLLPNPKPVGTPILDLKALPRKSCLCCSALQADKQATQVVSLPPSRLVEEWCAEGASRPAVINASTQTQPASLPSSEVGGVGSNGWCVLCLLEANPLLLHVMCKEFLLLSTLLSPSFASPHLASPPLL